MKMVTAYHHQATLRGNNCSSLLCAIPVTKPSHWLIVAVEFDGASFSHFKYCLEFLQTKEHNRFVSMFSNPLSIQVQGKIPR